MKRLWQQGGALRLCVMSIAILVMCAALPAQARQYAAMVMDARTGKVLHSRNADTRLHPASLTKMMTLYIAFEAVERGEIGLDDYVTVTKHAASEPPSKIYLKTGQKIRFRYLIRAAAVKSANDAATAIGVALEGSEAAFARRMNLTAQALGMKNTTFRNAHGLTQSGHLSTARDMTILGRHVFYDYPEYYNLFARRSTDAGGRTVYNTNRKLLSAYKGADGIKTGYTNAAGSNLVASAERGNVRIIATMFGGSSSAARNKRVAELLDMGFQRAPKYAEVRKPALPNYATTGNRYALSTSTPPQARPAQILALAAVPSSQDATAVAPPPATAAATVPTDLSPQSPVAVAEAPAPQEQSFDSPDVVTMRRGVEDVLAALPPQPDEDVTVGEAAKTMTQTDEAVAAALRPQPRPARVTYSTAQTPMALAEVAPQDPVVVSTKASARSGSWGVRVGRYATRWQAERVLLQTALQQFDLLGDTQRDVVSRPVGWEVEFVGLSESEARLACKRITALDERCAPFGS